MAQPKRRAVKASVREAVFSRFPYCVYCGWDFEHVEHLVPHSLSGDDSLANLVGSCALCNQIAGAKVFDSFADKRDYILAKLEKRFGKRIPLWTQAEVDDLGPSLRAHVVGGAFVCVTPKHREHIAAILRTQGYTPVYGDSDKPALTDGWGRPPRKGWA